jgi:signal transduction histidine kinase
MARALPRSWLRLPRRTARLRLTLLCSGMCLVLGTLVIAIIFALASGSATIRVSAAVPVPRPTVHVVAAPGKAPTVVTVPGTGTAAAKVPGKGTAAAKVPGKGTAVAKVPGKGTAVATVPGKPPTVGTVTGKSPAEAAVPGKAPTVGTVTGKSPAVAAVPGKGAVPPFVPVLGYGAKDEVVAQHSADVARLLEVSWFVLAITAVLSGLLGWFASGRVLRPVREMTATARTISAGNLGERLALTGPDDEFKQLGDTLDELLARLQDSFEAQRRFVANASHELRTPLTVERTVLQVALADPNATAATLRAACEELLASGHEQERLLEALLTLASSERGLDHRDPLDLAVVAADVLSAPRPEIERRRLQVETSLEPARTAGDPALVERLIANLVDNAVRYNDDGGQVEVRTWTDNGDSVVSVANTGPLVPVTEVQRLFEPFQRLEGRGTGGNHGLGLSIVRAIATAHGAAVTATARPGGGLRVTVRFTRADRAPAVN